MCGRLVTTTPAASVATYFDAVEVAEQLVDRAPGYNVPPTADLAVVVDDGGRRRLDVRRWGLVPSWAKDSSGASRMINARVETVATKPAYRAAFVRRRCIVPADGFYEWRAGTGGGPKQPFFVHRRDGEPMALAGLWETWHDPQAAEGAPPLRTCTVLTGPATGPMVEVHDRMPVMVGPAAWDAWLDPDLVDRDAVTSLLVPVPDDLLAIRPVSRAVNSVRNRGPELLDEVDPAAPDHAAPDPTTRGHGPAGGARTGPEEHPTLF